MMSAPDFVIRSRRVVLQDSVQPATISVVAGKILAIETYDAAFGEGVLDVGDNAVLPGLVDPHVHINEPGHSDWEGFATATRAAAAGGVTTVVDMPLNSLPVTTDETALAAKAQAASGQAAVDYGFWGGLVPGNAEDLDALLDAGALGVKCFLAPSGLDEFPHVEEEDLRLAMPILAAAKATLLAHAESAAEIAAAASRSPSASRRYSDYLASRPPAAELRAIELLIRLAAETGCAVHIVHLAAADALDCLAAARRDSLPISVETCPHYLAFAAEDIADGATVFKCAPPIRQGAHRERLWQALADGTIDFVASDHSPCPPPLKKLAKGDFMTAWGGIASLQLTLPAVWSEARRRGFGLEHVAAWLSERPARLAGLEGRKGRIAAGYDADLVVFEPERAFRVEPELLYHRHSLTPYAGLELRGVVSRTFLRGQEVDVHSPELQPRGRWLKRTVRGNR